MWICYVCFPDSAYLSTRVTCFSICYFFFYFAPCCHLCFLNVHPYMNTHTLPCMLLSTQTSPGAEAARLDNKLCPRPEPRRLAVVTGLPDGPQCWRSDASQLAWIWPRPVPLSQLLSWPRTGPGPEGSVLFLFFLPWKKKKNLHSQALFPPYFCDKCHIFQAN